MSSDMVFSGKKLHLNYFLKMFEYFICDTFLQSDYVFQH